MAIIGLIILLSLVFAGRIILPQFFFIGPLKIHYYGIIIALAVLAGYLLARKRSGQYGLGLKIADDIIFWTAIGGFAGARLYHILSSAAYYWHYPFGMLKVWDGGLSIYGAIIGGAVVMLLLAKSYKLKVAGLFDWLAPSVVLGQIIGRFGNLFNYEAFGYPTNLPWKMFVPWDFRPETLAGFAYFHPWFLYEASGNLVVLFVLLKMTQRITIRGRPGRLFLIYLLLYNILRFSLEFLRIDSTFIYGVRLNAAVSLITAACAALILACFRKSANAGSPNPAE